MSNARGITSKINSLKRNITELSPHIVAITETNLKGKAKLTIDGYEWISLNRKDHDGGGIGFLIQSVLLKHMVREPDEPLQNAEILWIRIILTREHHLCIGLYYGKQESYSFQHTQDEYQTIATQINIYLAKSYHVLLLGDFNAKIGNDQYGIPNGDPKVTRNGRLLRSMVDVCNIQVMNASPICEGKWTRMNTQNSNEKSILDYALASNSLAPLITRMVIDEHEDYKLHGTKNKTDHNTIIIEIKHKISPISVQTHNQRWKINHNTNWELFDQALGNCSKFNKLPNPCETNTEYYNNWLNHLNAVANRVIGKFMNSKRKPLRKDPRITDAFQAKKNAKKVYINALRLNNPDPVLHSQLQTATDNLIDIINQSEAERIEVKLMTLMKNGGINSKNFWNIKRKMTNDNLEDLHAIKNNLAQRLFNPQEIMAYTATYYEELFTPKESPNFCTEWTKYIENQNNSRKKIRNFEELPCNQPITKPESVKAISQLKNNKSPGPDNIPNEFIKNSVVMSKVLHNLMAGIFQSEDIPLQWLEGSMINFNKGKGDREVLSNKRGITLTSNVSKLFERILNSRVMGVITFSEAQAGGRPGRSTTDQIFILTEVLKQRKFENKPTYCAFIDVHKAYDEAWRGIIMHILWENNIKGKLWRVLFKLNNNITAKIATRFGLTRVINVEGGVKQGGVLSVVQFSKMMDVLDQELNDHELGVMFGNILISSLLFVDDIILFADSPACLQKMLDVSFYFFCKTHLRISKTKSKVIIFNKQNQDTHQTWTFGATIIHEAPQYKYLGQIFSEDLKQTAELQYKTSLVEGALATCLAVASNEVLHKMKLDTLLQLYNTCILPIILYGTETWTYPNYNDLEHLQHKCLKRILKIPTSTPNLAIIAETGSLHIQSLIHRRQLNYYHKILNTPGTLANQILNLQSDLYKNNNSNWSKYVDSLLKKYHLSYDPTVSKSKWASMCKKVTSDFSNQVYNDSKLSKMEMLLANKKVICREPYITQLLFKDAVIIFKARCRMLNLRNNFKGSGPISCEKCYSPVEDERHIFSVCPVLNDLRLQFNISNYDEIFNHDTEMLRLKEIAEFLKQVAVIFNRAF